MLQKTMKAATALTPVAAAKSSVELAAEYDRLTAERDSAATEYDRLKEGEPAASRAGVEDLLQHRDKMLRVAARRDVAAQRAEDTARLRDAALEREREDDRRARYDAIVAKRDDIRRKLAARYDNLAAELRDLLAAEKEAQVETEKVNRDLPANCPLLDHIEAPLRWIPAEPDREEEVAVEKAIKTSGNVYVSAGQPLPTEKVKEKRTVKGASAIRPAPLWRLFQAAGFKPGDADFTAPGIAFRPRGGFFDISDS
jgi:hypothetical protein